VECELHTLWVDIFSLHLCGGSSFHLYDQQEAEEEEQGEEPGEGFRTGETKTIDGGSDKAFTRTTKTS